MSESPMPAPVLLTPLQQMGGRGRAPGVSRSRGALRQMLSVAQREGCRAPLRCVLESMHQRRLSKSGENTLWAPCGSQEYSGHLHSACL